MKKTTTLASPSAIIDRLIGHTAYDTVKIVADDIDNVSAVGADIANVNIVKDNIDSVNTVAGEIDKVVKVADDLIETISEVETVANDLNEANSEIETVANNMPIIDLVAQDTIAINEFYNNKEEVYASGPNSIVASDAALEATSAASEAEDMHTKTYNDGIPTDTTEYSAKHYAAKSESNNTSAYNYAFLAETSATDAQGYMNSAAASEASATSSEATATVAANIAEKWAAEDIGVEVEPGKYSALHYADLLNSLDIYDIETKLESNELAIVANQEAIASLATAQGSFASDGGIYPISLTTDSQIMPFDIVNQSNDLGILGIGTDSTVTFNDDANYTFMSTVTFQDQGANGTPHLVEFNIKDNATGITLGTQEVTVEITNGDIAAIPLNTLFSVIGAPVELRFEVIMDGTGYDINSWSSIVASQGGATDISSIGTYEDFSTAFQAALI